MARRDTTHIWPYRGRDLVPVEWGLSRDLDRRGRYFLCYRPEVKRGPVVRTFFGAESQFC